MEQVYVLPARAFPKAQDRLLPLEAPFLRYLEREGFFLPRLEAEENPAYRQVIPYALVRYAGQYLLMRRKRAGGEARLFDRFTLGVGGHINPEDAGENPVETALGRELYEEVGLQRYTARAVGLIVLDDTPVSRVHAGVVFVVEAEEEPAVVERDKLEGRLCGLEEIWAVYEGLEDWSKRVADWLRDVG
ncbi:NUDIX domain-containing protein [Meiothermus rufus]|uniref:NUDIX domain-containing protein n=1 Tax=Meiothermus rufus TaxID=604332 RepID=UPI000413D8F6|nr:NUDIX domain-containing protein [Meiothermus rufus]